MGQFSKQQSRVNTTQNDFIIDDRDEELEFEKEMTFLRTRLEIANQKRIEVKARRIQLAKRLHIARSFRNAMIDRINQLSYQKSMMLDKMDSLYH